MTRVFVLALLVACACLARAADDTPDIENNEVLPENDVVRARVDEVPSLPTNAPPSTSRVPETTPTSTAAPSDPSTPDDAQSDAKDVPPSTTAPPRQPSTLSRFLADIIQIPIAVLRSVSSLLSNTFSGQRNSTSTTPST